MDTMAQGHQQQIGLLEDALKAAERRIEELRRERDEQSVLINKMRTHVEDCADQIDRWKDAFEMVPDDKGIWTWPPDTIYQRYDQLGEMYDELLERWNRFVGKYNAVIAPRNMGRPLAASEAQCANVLKRRKAGQSLRDIAEDTNLSLRTVRTIIDKKDGVDRATMTRLKRIAPDKLAQAKDRARKRLRANLPRQIDETRKQGAELVKAAKGLR